MPHACSSPILALLFIPQGRPWAEQLCGELSEPLPTLHATSLSLLYQPSLRFEMPLSPWVPKFPSLLRDFKLSPWSVLRGNSCPPVSLPSSWRALRSSPLPSVVLFSLSPWQGLRREPGKEGGGKKVSRKSSAARTGEPDWSRRRLSETRDSCFVWVYFGYGVFFFSLGLFPEVRRQACKR